MTTVVRALQRECETLVAALSGLTEDDFLRPTNCPPWNLKELVVHTHGSVTLPDPIPPPAANASICEAADYYRRAERNTEEYRTRNVRIAQDAAKRFPSGREAVEDMRATVKALIERLDSEDLNALVRYGDKKALHFGDYLLTRLLAVSAHGIDIAITLHIEPWTRDETSRLLAPMLISLLGQPPPADLGWDDRRLLEAGTGRRPLSEGERASLGEAALLFPLIS